MFLELQRVPTLRGIWDLEKTVLHEIRVSGTVGGPLLTRKSPTCTYISQKLGSGNRVSDFRVNLMHRNKNVPSEII